jgi:hypothetical protein
MDATDALVLAVHLAATAAMTGLIWFVQVVHYPLFAGVGPDGFERYEVEHQQRTSFVVGPFMAVEGCLGLWLLASPPDGLGRALPFAGCVLLAVIHASTVLLQVPAHGRLGSGYDATVVRRLVRTNWIRTAGWSARAVVAVAMLAVAA